MASIPHLNSKAEFWKLPENPWDLCDDFDNLDVLSDMIRDQYLRRLRKTLMDNLNVGPASYRENTFTEIQECVDVCMAEMEQQALRQCMAARIYSQGMKIMINEVKTCTENSILYCLLEHSIESNNLIPFREKNCYEDENMSNKSARVDTYTKRKSKKITSKRIKLRMDSDFSLPNNKSVNNNNSSPAGKHVEVKCNNVSTTITNVQDKSEPDIGINNKRTYDMCINELVGYLEGSSEYEQFDSMIDDLSTLPASSTTDEPVESTSDLPAPININPNTFRSEKVNEILKDKLKTDRVALTFAFNKSMDELPNAEQIHLNQMFDDLFGADHSYESEPFSKREEGKIFVKKIMRMVLQFLESYSEEQVRCMNQNVLKNVAQFVTKMFLDTFGLDEF